MVLWDYLKSFLEFHLDPKKPKFEAFFMKPSLIFVSKAYIPNMSPKLFKLCSFDTSPGRVGWVPITSFVTSYSGVELYTLS